MKGKKHGFALLMGAIYAILSLGLLVAVTGAKYTDDRLVYADFEAADFNAAILLQDPAPTEEGENPDPDAETQVLRVDVSRIRPGMEKEDALRIPFWVGNGPSEQDTSDVTVKYTVRVRSGKHITPLTYSIEGPQQVVPEGETEEQTQVKTYGSWCDPDPLERKENQQLWYEHTFYQSLVQESTPPAVTRTADQNNQDDQTNQPGQGEQETPAGQKPTGAEVEFLLEPEKSGDFRFNAHTLVVEWPSGGDNSSYDYMKEVEILEILVTAYSVNHLAEEDYIPDTIPDEAEEKTYTPGVILLTKPAAGNQKTYSYTLDLRAFRGNKDSRTFHFYTDNAVAYQQAQTAQTITYKIDMTVPLKRTENKTLPVPTYEFQHLELTFQLDGTPMKKTNNYIIRNEKTGAEQEVTGKPTAAQLTPDDRVYVKYIGIAGKKLENFEANAGRWEPIASRTPHYMTISGNDLTFITDEPLEDTYSFLYKLELNVTATFSDPPPELPPETTAAATTESSEPPET